jgi:hypothetical protein
MAEGRLLDAQAERALALAMTGDVAGARREIDAVVKQSGDAVKSEYTLIRGTIEHLAGQYAAALALQQKALEQIATRLGLHPDPMQADARAALGR